MNYGDKKSKNVVLNLTKNLPAEVESFLLEIRMKIASPDVPFEKFRMKTVLVDEVSEDVQTVLDRLEIDSHGVRVLSIVSPENIFKFITQGGSAVLCTDWLKTTWGKHVWKEYLLMEELSVHLDEGYKDILDGVQSLHLTNHFSSGFYSDSVVSYAADKNFDYVRIRNYYNYVVSYLNLLRQNKISTYPFDIEFGHSVDCFALRFLCKVSNFSNDLIASSFNEPSFTKNISAQLLSLASDAVPVFDIGLFSTSDTLTITGIWPAKNDVNESASEKSLLIRYVSKLPAEKVEGALKLDPFSLPSESVKNKLDENDLVQSFSDDLRGFEEKTVVNGEEEYEPTEEELESAAEEFIENEYITGEKEKIIDEIYRIKGDSENITDEFIRISSLKNNKEEKLKELSKSLGISEEVAEASFSDMMDSLVEIQNKTFGKPLEEAAEIIRSSITDLDEETILIHSAKINAAKTVKEKKEKIKKSIRQKLKEEHSLQKKTIENVVKGDEQTKVSGSKDELDNTETLVSGNNEGMEETQTISGGAAEDEFAQTIKGAEEEGEKVHNIKGYVEDKDDTEYVVSGENELPKEKDSMNVRDLFKEIVIDNFNDLVGGMGDEIKVANTGKLLTKAVAKFCKIKDKDIIGEILKNTKKYIADHSSDFASAKEDELERLALDYKAVIVKVIPAEQSSKFFDFNSQAEDQPVNAEANKSDKLAGEKLEKMSRERDYWRSKHDELKVELFKKDNRNESQIEINELEKKNSYLEKQLEIEKRKSAQLVENLKVEKENVLKESGSKQEILKLKAEITQAHNLSENFRKKEKEAEQKVQYYQNEINALRDTHEQELELTVKKTKHELERSLSNKTSDQSLKDIAKEKETRKKIVEVERKNKELEIQLSKARSLINNTKNKNSDANKENVLAKKIEHLDKVSKKSAEMLSAANSQNTELKKQNSKMKAEATGLKNKISVMEKELERFKKRRAG